jgi:hypothetical protein
LLSWVLNTDNSSRGCAQTLEQKPRQETLVRSDEKKNLY